MDAGEIREVKMYSDFKSPYAYLAFDPAFALEDKYRIRMKWKPFQLRIKGKGQRSQYSEYKVKYSYMDARRWANQKGGLMIRGPLKIFDTTPALIGGLFAEKHGKVREYGNRVFEQFFKRELAADEADAVAKVVASLGSRNRTIATTSRAKAPPTTNVSRKKRSPIMSSACPCSISKTNSSGAMTAWECSSTA